MRKQEFPRVDSGAASDEEKSLLTRVKERFGWYAQVGQVFGRVAHHRGPVYRGTASRNKVAKRRAKNKVARRSRQINRRHK